MQDWILEAQVAGEGSGKGQWIRPAHCLSSSDSPQNLSRKVDFALTWVCLNSTSSWGENLPCFWIPLPEGKSFSPHGHLYSPKGKWKNILLLHRVFPSRAPLLPKGEWKNIFPPTLFPSWTPLFPKKGMEGHFSPTPSFSLTGTFIP